MASHHEDKLTLQKNRIKRFINDLQLAEKMKSVALLYYLERKKELDVQLEQEFCALKKNHEKKA